MDMTLHEVAKSVMKITGTTQQQIAEKAGLAGQGTVGMYLQSKSMRVDALLTILNGCGYDLVARDPNGKYPEFVIGESQRNEVNTKNGNDIESIVRKIVDEEIARRIEHRGE